MRQDIYNDILVRIELNFNIDKNKYLLADIENIYFRCLIIHLYKFDKIKIILMVLLKIIQL